MLRRCFCRRWMLLCALAVLGGTTACSDNTTGPTEAPPEFLAANGVNGGRLYDKFWAAETRFNLSDPNVATFNSRSDFFRCKQCHGWDRLGTAGAYVNRGPRSSRPNISSVNLAGFVASSSPQQIFDAIKRGTGRRAPTIDLSTYNPATNFAVGYQMPDYGQILTDGQMWELVKFLKNDAFDTRDLYDSEVTGSYPTGKIVFTSIGRDGDADRGDGIFSQSCSFCHGFNGTSIKVDGGAFTVGRHLRSKPYEDAHKIRFGQLGSPMTSTTLILSQMKDLYKALSNSTRYPD